MLSRTQAASKAIRDVLVDATDVASDAGSSHSHIVAGDDEDAGAEHADTHGQEQVQNK